MATDLKHTETVGEEPRAHFISAEEVLFIKDEIEVYEISLKGEHGVQNHSHTVIDDLIKHFNSVEPDVTRRLYDELLTELNSHGQMVSHAIHGLYDLAKKQQGEIDVLKKDLAGVLSSTPNGNSLGGNNTTVSTKKPSQLVVAQHGIPMMATGNTSTSSDRRYKAIKLDKIIIQNPHNQPLEFTSSTGKVLVGSLSYAWILVHRQHKSYHKGSTDYKEDTDQILINTNQYKNYKPIVYVEFNDGQPHSLTITAKENDEFQSASFTVELLNDGTD